jgi:hypothetical protein
MQIFKKNCIFSKLSILIAIKLKLYLGPFGGMLWPAKFYWLFKVTGDYFSALA